MGNVVQLMSSTGAVIIAFVIGLVVGRIGAYTMGMKYGMQFAIRQTYLNFCRIFKKHGIYELFRDAMEKEAIEQGWKE